MSFPGRIKELIPVFIQPRINFENNLTLLYIQHILAVRRQLNIRHDAAIQPDGVYQMSGNQISVQTLDPNCDFEDIRQQLDYIVKIYFN